MSPRGEILCSSLHSSKQKWVFTHGDEWRGKHSPQGTNITPDGGQVQPQGQNLPQGANHFVKNWPLVHRCSSQCIKQDDFYLVLINIGYCLFFAIYLVLCTSKKLLEQLTGNDDMVSTRVVVGSNTFWSLGGFKLRILATELLLETEIPKFAQPWCIIFLAGPLIQCMYWGQC
jgi:hypothetical protein